MNKKQIITGIALLTLGMLIGKFAFSEKPVTSVKTMKRQGENLEEHWTCSMHPQIDLPEPGQCPICGMDLIPKETNHTIETASSNTFTMSSNAMALANIETLVVGDNKTDSQAFQGLQISGKIAVNDRQSAVQAAHFSGRIEHLFYKSTGEYVSRGSRVASLYAPGLVTAQNELIEAMKFKQTQPDLYRAIRNKLKHWKLSEKQIRQIEQKGEAITNFDVYANVSGYISTIMVGEGDYVKEGSPLFKVSDLSNVWAVFDVYEKDLPALYKGQEINIHLNAYPGMQLRSRIDYIYPVLDKKTRTVKVRASLKNTKNLFKPGMLLIGKIRLQTKTSQASNPIIIPKSAVLWTGKRSVVYVKKAPDKPEFEMREVQLGRDSGTGYQILSGLTTGEEIVINGTFTVDAAAQIQGKKSMMNKTAGTSLNKHDKMQMNKKKTPKTTTPEVSNPELKTKKNNTAEMKCGAGKCGSDMK